MNSATSSSGRPVLTVRGLSVSRAHTLVEDVSLEIWPGECVAVVGESGAGKSVLARTLLGLNQSQPGWTVRAEQFDVAGRDMRRATRRGWRALRGTAVSLILQDALQSLDPLRTIGAEVGETLAIRSVQRRDRAAAVVAALTAAGLPDAAMRATQRSHELSGGQRQRALIASALIGAPRLVIADEPTTALDPTTATHVLNQFREITAGGTSMLLITHDLESVARVADRVIVLDQGRVVEAGPTHEILTRPTHAVTRRLISAVPRGPKPANALRARSAPLLTLRGVGRSYTTPKGRTVALRDVDLELRAGEALGIVGESGAGKTTLARIITGAETPDVGTLEHAHAHADTRVRLVPQDPMSTFDPRWSVEKIIMTSNRRAGVTCERLLQMVGLDGALGGRLPASLSGGQRQRVAIARALAAAPEVLVCDEPVSALDVATQADILDLLRRLQADAGVSIVLISHDLAAVRTVCDRLAVMRNGEIVEAGATEPLLAHPREAFTRELIASARALPIDHSRKTLSEKRRQ